MSVVKFKIDGLEELRRALKALPKELQGEAEWAVMKAARETREKVIAVYQEHRSTSDYYMAKAGIRRPRRHLADNVLIDARSRIYGSAYARVLVDAPHAHLFEYGTAERQWASGKGTGAAPAHRTMVPTAVRVRGEMVAELIAIVEGAGFEVRGA